MFPHQPSHYYESPPAHHHQPTVFSGATYKFNKHTDNHKSISSAEPTKTVKEELTILTIPRPTLSLLPTLINLTLD